MTPVHNELRFRLADMLRRWSLAYLANIRSGRVNFVAAHELCAIGRWPRILTTLAKDPIAVMGVVLPVLAAMAARATREHHPKSPSRPVLHSHCRSPQLSQRWCPSSSALFGQSRQSHAQLRHIGPRPHQRHEISLRHRLRHFQHLAINRTPPLGECIQRHGYFPLAFAFGPWPQQINRLLGIMHGTQIVLVWAITGVNLELR